MSEVILIGGGVRSGKSNFAVTRALKKGARRAFVATANRSDNNMIERIDRHRQDRGDAFSTFEIPQDLAGELVHITREFDVVVIDCLTLWTSNLLVDGYSEIQILAALDLWLKIIASASSTVICVTNEVGMGVHPPSELGRAFADVAGRVHQRVARQANEVYIAILGMIVRLKPNPIECILT